MSNLIHNLFWHNVYFKGPSVFIFGLMWTGSFRSWCSLCVTVSSLHLEDTDIICVFLHICTITCCQDGIKINHHTSTHFQPRLFWTGSWGCWRALHPQLVANQSTKKMNHLNILGSFATEFLSICSSSITAIHPTLSTWHFLRGVVHLFWQLLTLTFTPMDRVTEKTLPSNMRTCNHNNKKAEKG